MKGLLGTDPYQCILYGDQLRFAGAQVGHHATQLLSEKLNGIAKTIAADQIYGSVRLKFGIRIKNNTKLFLYVNSREPLSYLTLAATVYDDS